MPPNHKAIHACDALASAPVYSDRPRKIKGAACRHCNSRDPLNAREIDLKNQFAPTKGWLIAATALALLAGCGNKNSDSPPAGAPAAAAAPTGPELPESKAETYAASLNDGIFWCFDKARAKLGDAMKFQEIVSYYEKPDTLNKGPTVRIGNRAEVPAGSLTTCHVDYQDPQNKLKMLRLDMNVHSGEWNAPEALEINVIGNADSFKLEDHLVPASIFKPEALQKQFDALKPRLEARFSVYQNDAVRFEAQGPQKAVMNVNFYGRLKTNDLISNVSVGVPADGASVDLRNLK